MSLLDALRKAEHWLGFTRETSDETFYETITEDAVVKAKEPLPGLPKGYELFVRFDGPDGPRVMQLDVEAFDRLSLNERVRLCCRKVYRHVFDYVPPDFDNLRRVGQELEEYKFISAVRI